MEEMLALHNARPGRTNIHGLEHTEFFPQSLSVREMQASFH